MHATAEASDNVYRYVVDRQRCPAVLMLRWTIADRKKRQVYIKVGMHDETSCHAHDEQRSGKRRHVSVYIWRLSRGMVSPTSSHKNKLI